MARRRGALFFLPFIAFELVFGLRHTGRPILNRLLDVVLAAPAVQFVANGTRELMAV